MNNLHPLHQDRIIPVLAMIATSIRVGKKFISGNNRYGLNLATAPPWSEVETAVLLGLLRSTGEPNYEIVVGRDWLAAFEAGVPEPQVGAKEKRAVP